MFVFKTVMRILIMTTHTVASLIRKNLQLNMLILLVFALQYLMYIVI